MARRKRRSAEAWAREVEIWRGSGLSAVAYAERNGLSAKRLRWWGRRLEEESGPVLVEVEVADAPRDPRWEVTAGDGARLVVFAELSPGVAAAVVGAMVGRR